MKPNTKFTLCVKDVEHIENALHLLQASIKDDAKKKEIVELKAKLYHQKHWYRHRTNYVGG